MAVVYIKSSWYYTGDRRPAITTVGVGTGPKKGVVVVVIVIIIVIVVVALKV